MSWGRVSQQGHGYFSTVNESGKRKVLREEMKTQNFDLTGKKRNKFCSLGLLFLVMGSKDIFLKSFNQRKGASALGRHPRGKRRETDPKVN